MKKILFGLIVFVLAACNNNSESTTITDTTVSNTSGVENVNGNLPDTTNTITIDGGKPETTPIDTTRNPRDTIRR
ncbi:MAG: membrane lipoprotein lipid attachment site-containing protein [Bacteroidota bacterium]|nr:membrane lipoprotein lipid attachment site-containing protein [Bacteroidota bacterium]